AGGASSARRSSGDRAGPLRHGLSGADGRRPAPRLATGRVHRRARCRALRLGARDPRAASDGDGAVQGVYGRSRDPSRSVNRYGPLLLMLGLLLGPVYYLFCEYSSGTPGETFTLSERAARWTLADGTILHFVRGQAYRPLTLKLDPQMNRIAFRLTF